MTNSSPRPQWAISAARLDWVPLGKKRPASWPVIWASRSCRSLTVGSSPNTSSPTAAAAMRSRMAAVGRVTVSLRRSIMRAAGSRSVARALGARRRGGSRGGVGLLQRGPILVHGLGHRGGGVVGIGGVDRAGILVQKDVVAVVLGELAQHLDEFLLDGLQQLLAALLDELAALVDEVLELRTRIVILLLQRIVVRSLGIGLVQLVLEGLGLVTEILGLGLELRHLLL